jgi:predicted nucleic acid-binding Zn ribbon protein
MEELQSIAEPPLTRCPSCNTDGLDRILGGGAGLIFKGTGFYLTDYGKDSKRSSGGGKKEEKKEDQKAEAKPEKKDEKKVEKPASPGGPAKE